jgi:hypothetical protein
MHASGALLKRAAAINETLAALLPGGRTAFIKGVYRYRTLEEANRHQDEMLAELMSERRAPDA